MKSKKAVEFNYLGIVLIILTIIFMISFSGPVSTTIATFSSCDYMDMEYKNLPMGEVCIDNLNQAHFVNIKCEGWFWNKQCKATIINIGEFRIR